ncbi:MAG: alpha/beta hydrolase [candidate division NC10 bacterium]|nr:alpha/beta hydrolase [candidate division NC10 bacterium]MBI2113979.1 alpha/beta hydrolase [candidate division NC10 bacterium]
MSPVSGDLSVRTRGVGGPVAPEVVEIPRGWILGRRRVLVLVHGYNNTDDEARRSYHVYTQNLEGVLTSDRLPELGRFFWPGDSAWGFLSALSYPWEIGDARQSASRLARFFAGVFGPEGGPTELNFVGHSLGCRLLLEALALVASGAVGGWPEVRRLCLMAAAVPVELVEATGRLEAAARWPRSLLLLYSPDDSVLHFAFPIGQAAAFALGEEDGLYLTAVGRHGQPSGLTPYRVELSGDGHSDYWPDARAARLMSAFLGQAVPRELASHGRLTRPEPEARPLSKRQIQSREAPER